MRLEIGDTLSADPQLSNEAILQAVSERSSTVGAAILCCDWLIAKYARLVTQSAGKVNVSYSDRLKQYETLLGRLRLRAPSSHPFAGGTDSESKLAADNDPSRDAPIFKVGMHDRRL